MNLIFLVISVACIILLIRIFKRPIRFIFKLLLNTVVGIVLIFIVNILGAGIAITFVNALIVGILGIPGVLLLLFGGAFL